MTEAQSSYHCHKCLWFYAVDDTDPDPENWTGECRRYAPTPHKYQPVGSWTVGSANQVPDATTTFGNAVPDNTAPHWVWPYCVGGWFCGDYKPYDGQYTSG